MASTAQKVLRMFGDRIGKGRLKSTIEFQKTYPPRGMALVTGEDLPGGHSSVARFLGLELLQGQIDLELLTDFQNNSKPLAEAMHGYISWLLPQIDELPQKLGESFKQYRVKLQAEAAHGRLGEASAWLLIAFELLLDYCLSVDAVNTERADKLRQQAEKVMCKLVIQQGRLVNQETPAEIFCNALHELFLSSKVKVSPLIQGFSKTDSYYFSAGEDIGWIDKDYIYLNPDTAYNAVFKFLGKRGEDIPVRPNTLWKHLAEAGLLLTVKEGDYTRHKVKVTIPAKKGEKQSRPRLLHLKQKAYEDFVGK